jgi:alpha-mannosidase
MLKHPDLTLRRAQAFLWQTLRPAEFGDRTPLKIEFNERDCADQAEAERGPWQTVEPGFAYGPAYRTVWFRLSGVVPESLAGKPLVVFAEIGGERTVWKDNSPWCGVDVEHSDFGWLSGAALAGREVPAVGGESVSYTIQVYTRNSETVVHGHEKPRSATTEKVEFAGIAAVDYAIRDLIYDFEFTLGLTQSIQGDDPAYHTLLRGLNDVCNTFSPKNRETISRCRKLIRDALGSLNGELKHTITPVGHAHLDTAWLWPIHITRKKMAHTTATQLGLIDRYPEYVFVHSQASQYEWLETDYPVLFEKVKSAIAKGQWEPVGSMWVEADCNLTGGESLVRQFLYGKRYFREKLGYETLDMWLPDVFGYSAALPQILSKFNIRYFLTQKISWNQFNKFPHHTFWWQGIDGTRVWSHFPPADTYNASAEPKEVLYSVKNFKDHARSDQSLYVYGFGDGGGGPTEKHIEFLRRGRMAPHYPEVALGKRAVDFFREAKSKSKDLQTWVGELYLELHRGTYTSQAANKKLNRHCEFLLRDAEWLASFTPGYPQSYPRAELEAAWKLVLLNQFHDIIPGSSVKEVYEDSNVDYAKVIEIGERVISDSLTRIGRACDTTSLQRPVAIFQNGSLVTQGEIPWTDAVVPNSLITADEIVPVQIVEGLGDRKLVFPVPQGALGTVVVGDLSDALPPQFPAAKPRLKASIRRIENGELSVRFDQNGNITSIQSLEDGSEFIEPGKLANVFQLFDDKPLFWSAWDIDAFAYETQVDLLRSDSIEVVERGPVRAAVEIVRTFGKSTIRQRISLGPTPGIRFDTEIDWQETDKLLKVAFPANVNASRATYEIQFGNVERPTHYNTSWDMAKFEVCAQKWVDLSEGECGLALLNDGKYGHDVHGNVIRLSLLRAPKAPDPTCDMGVHRFSYVVMPHFGPYNIGGVVTAAYALNAPMRHALLDQHAGENGMLPTFVSVENRNIVIESVKKAEDNSDLIVRLYECHNTRGRAELSCARHVHSVAVCDLEENELVELDVNDNLIPFDFKPFEIITLRLRV